MSGQDEHSRRSFISGGWRDLLRGLADDAASPKVAATTGVTLRPPGALPEPEFLDACARSGDCAAACPVQAIRVLKHGEPRGRGTPVIVAGLQACVVCQDLSCMKACPSGALRVLPVDEIRMGLALLRDEQCLRSRGDDCRLCVEKCPLGPRAIAIGADGRVSVREPGCIGCGVCEMVCPTLPRAIVVRPAHVG